MRRGRWLLNVSKRAYTACTLPPAQFGLENAGQLYEIPKDQCERLHFNKFLPSTMVKQVQTLGECVSMIRQPLLEVSNIIKVARPTFPAIRICLWGPFGTGKSMTLHQAVHLAHTDGWVIIYQKSATEITRRVKEVEMSSYITGRINDPSRATEILQVFKHQNAPLWKRLAELQTSKEYIWTKNDKTEKGKPITEIAEMGLSAPYLATDCVGALFRELKHYASSGEIKVLVAIDDANSLWGKTLVKKADRTYAKPHELALVNHYRNLLTNEWSNGATLLISDVHDKLTVPLNTPLELFGDEGFDFIDPFIPIETLLYTKEETDTIYDYYMEKGWLTTQGAQNNVGRIQIRELAGYNPYNYERLCAFVNIHPGSSAMSLDTGNYDSAEVADSWEDNPDKAVEVLAEKMKQVQIMKRSDAERKALAERTQKEKDEKLEVDRIEKERRVAMGLSTEGRDTSPPIQMKLMRRKADAPKIEPDEEANKKPQKSLEERTADYHKARTRIFGEDYKPEAEPTPAPVLNPPPRSKSPEVVTVRPAPTRGNTQIPLRQPPGFQQVPMQHMQANPFHNGYTSPITMPNHYGAMLDGTAWQGTRVAEEPMRNNITSKPSFPTPIPPQKAIKFNASAPPFCPRQDTPPMDEMCGDQTNISDDYEHLMPVPPHLLNNMPNPYLVVSSQYTPPHPQPSPSQIISVTQVQMVQSQPFPQPYPAAYIGSSGFAGPTPNEYQQGYNVTPCAGTAPMEYGHHRPGEYIVAGQHPRSPGQPVYFDPSKPPPHHVVPGASQCYSAAPSNSAIYYLPASQQPAPVQPAPLPLMSINTMPPPDFQRVAANCDFYNDQHGKQPSGGTRQHNGQKKRSRPKKN
ncbi:unnamed protein product, partial [Mesorhabditis spiculigera]